MNGFWYFWQKCTDKVGNQETLYYATSNKLCFCTTWLNGEHENCLPISISALLEFNHSLLIYSVFLNHDSYLRCCVTP